MKRNDKQQKGQAGEDQALRFLNKAGLTLLERNYRSRWGEIDLVMRDKNCIVFIEVRVRSNAGFGGAAASVDSRKQEKLRKTALIYLQQHKASSRQAARFDVVACAPHQQELRCDWIQDAF